MQYTLYNKGTLTSSVANVETVITTLGAKKLGVRITSMVPYQYDYRTETINRDTVKIFDIVYIGLPEVAEMVESCYYYASVILTLYANNGSCIGKISGPVNVDGSSLPVKWRLSKKSLNKLKFTVAKANYSRIVDSVVITN
jgi:hypothetical protein